MKAYHYFLKILNYAFANKYIDCCLLKTNLVPESKYNHMSSTSQIIVSFLYVGY
jgi:hypothetical protein